MSIAQNLSAALQQAQQVVTTPLDITNASGRSPRFACPASLQTSPQIAFVGTIKMPMSATRLPESAGLANGTVVVDTYVVRTPHPTGTRYLFAYVAGNGDHVVGFDRAFGADATLTAIRMEAVKQKLVRITPESALLAIGRCIAAGESMTPVMARTAAHFRERMLESPLALVAIAAAAPDCYTADEVAAAAERCRVQFDRQPGRLTRACQVLDTVFAAANSNTTRFVMPNLRKIQEIIWKSAAAKPQSQPLDNEQPE